MGTPAASLHATTGRRRQVPGTRAVWASLAISAMWAAVFLTALFGGDFTTGGAGPDGFGGTTIPSGVFVGLFACIGTFFTARYGLREDTRADAPDDDRITSSPAEQ